MGSLRQKLQFSYGLLILIILAVCLWGIYHLSRLGRAVDVILVNNYKSIVAAENMKEALERQDSAVMFFIAGQADKARRQFMANSERFSASSTLQPTTSRNRAKRKSSPTSDQIFRLPRTGKHHQLNGVNSCGGSLQPITSLS